MKLLDLRKNLKQQFNSLGIDPVDVDFIIADTLNLPITELTFVGEISSRDEEQILNFANLRMQGIPVTKIFKKAHFYGLEFVIDEKVLSPRQDSELVVDTALKYIQSNNINTVLDLCTGSGCLAISVKKNADVKIDATDVSVHALKIAKDNAKLNNVEINFFKSDMFENVSNKYDLILSNPPYIATDEIKELDGEVKNHDPILALDGGDMGLKFYNIIHNNARAHLTENGILILEIGYDQADLVKMLFNDFNLLEKIQDYSGNDRVLVFSK